MGDPVNFSADAIEDSRRKAAAEKEPDPFDFGAAEQALNDAAKRVNGIWIAFILLCVYIFIATYTVTPANLFRDSPVRLPIFNAELPLQVYFLIAPFLIIAMHFYLIVLIKGLSEKIAVYEFLLNRPNSPSAKFTAGRRAITARLDNSILLQATSVWPQHPYRGTNIAKQIIAGATVTIMPITLLLLTQLIFLPRQEELMTWIHRGFVFADFLMCLWLWFSFAPRSWPRPVVIGRLFAGALILLAVMTSIFLAAFPGESIYASLDWPRHLTTQLFEGPPDPVDPVRQQSALPFPNRLIVSDDPKLADAAGPSGHGNVSLSVRGRNFRRAVFDRSNLAGVDFSAAVLDGASFEGAKLEGAKFDCAFSERGNGAVISYNPGEKVVCTHLNEASLTGAKLDHASFGGAEMNGASMAGATLTKTSFQASSLLGANFSNVSGSGTDFTRTKLVASNFANAQLFAADFNEAALQGSTLINTRFQKD